MISLGSTLGIAGAVALIAALLTALVLVARMIAKGLRRRAEERRQAAAVLPQPAPAAKPERPTIRLSSAGQSPQQPATGADQPAPTAAGSDAGGPTVPPQSGQAQQTAPQGEQPAQTGKWTWPEEETPGQEQTLVAQVQTPAAGSAERVGPEAPAPLSEAAGSEQPFVPAPQAVTRDQMVMVGTSDGPAPAGVIWAEPERRSAGVGSEVDSLRGEIEALKEQRAALARQIGSMNEDIGEIEQRKAQVRRELRSLQKEAARLAGSKAQIERDVTKHRRRAEELAAQNRDLLARIRELEAARDEAARPKAPPALSLDLPPFVGRDTVIDEP